jgi:hypothetical protein
VAFLSPKENLVEPQGGTKTVTVKQAFVSTSIGACFGVLFFWECRASWMHNVDNRVRVCVKYEEYEEQMGWVSELNGKSGSEVVDCLHGVFEPGDSPLGRLASPGKHRNWRPEVTEP